MKKENTSLFVGAAAFILSAIWQQNALALPPIMIGDVNVGSITGYIREHAQWNLQDHPDPQSTAPGSPSMGGKNELSMLRTSLYLQYVSGDLPYDTKLTLIGRLVKESRTTYLKRLDANPLQVGDLMDHYNSNANAIREAYLDIPLSDSVNLRLGKQQVVWGETDLLQALDIVNPRDLSWRALFEPEDEEWRKPQIMANLNIAVPDLKGSLQLLYRPGWDKKDQVGNTLDGFGGRWSPQGSRGVNSFGLIGFNYDHPEGNYKDASYGFRWTGVAGESNIGYSLAYYHTLSGNPLLNVKSSGIVPGVTLTPYKGSIGSKSTDMSTIGAPVPPGTTFAEFILPAVDIVGGSLNAYVTPLDLVFRTEAAATLRKPYNAETAFGGKGLPTILEKNTINFMVGFDKQLSSTMNLLGTDSAAFWTVQVFDSWIPGFKAEDKLMDGANATISNLKEHSVIAVTSLSLSYKSNQVQPGIILVNDTSNGGGVIIPNVNLLYGNHWRLRLDAQFFYKAQDACTVNPTDPNPATSGAYCTHLFGTYNNNNQLSARLTYQF